MYATIRIRSESNRHLLPWQGSPLPI